MLGPPGAGKGTLSRILSEGSGFLPVSTGERIRREMADPNSRFGREARPYMDRGDYVPDDLALSLFFTILAQERKTARLTLDGFPRTIPQAQAFLQWVADAGHRLHGCVHIDVDDGIAISRLQQRRICRDCRAPYHLQTRPPRQAGHCDLCGGPLIVREDDDAERLASRMARFREQTRPLIRWLADRVPCVQLDGAGEPEILADQLIGEWSLQRKEN